jgi:hypothetical protein
MVAQVPNVSAGGRYSSHDHCYYHCPIDPRFRADRGILVVRSASTRENGEPKLY